MKIKNTSHQKWTPAVVVLLCIILVGGLGAILLNIKAQAAGPMTTTINSSIIDDFNKSEGHKNNLIWFISNSAKPTDSVDARKDFIQNEGISSLHVKGTVSSRKNWDIVGTQLDLPQDGAGLKTTGQDGIYLKAKGTDGAWTLSFWLQNAQGRSQLYQAQFELTDQWREVQLPLRMFSLLDAGKPSDNRELFRISPVVFGRQRAVEIDLDEIGFYREQKMYKKLTPAEERVIVHKGTERPFTGEYDKHYEKGTYTCKRCGAALYESSSKFKSGCGWPSFDDQIEGAVKWQPDADGIRTEIICNNCGAHLGHVFQGEGFTAKNVRHCVNSISLDFIPASGSQTTQTAKAIFASGCFWGTEYYFQKAPGVISTTVGYTGGHVDNPTYKQVCTDTTGHAEAVEVVYDPSVISYEQLAKLFFETHDFTQMNRQGPDIGKQYRSAIFYLDKEQQEIATNLVQQLREKGFDVKTQVEQTKKFWPAEEYHQDYYQKTAKQPYCHIYRKIF
jgi:peptide methionine sulfoxide reductase msrA/msrB